jgi:hypothetical protein
MKVQNQFSFAVSLVLLIAFCWSVVGQILFLNRAEHGVGVVRELRAHNDRCGEKIRHDCTRFLATVELQVAGSTRSSYLDAGETGGHDQPLSKARHQVGDRVPFVFDPSRPEEIYRDEFWDVWGMSLGWLVFFVGALAASLRREESDELATLDLNAGR